MDEKELNRRIRRATSRSWVRELLDYAIWFAGVWILVQLIIHFVGVFSVVDGDSMQPTLYNGEYLWVNKFSYHFSDPERFDIVIFPVTYAGQESHFVKRVIGLPGETVYIDEEGKIYIDGEVLEENYGKEPITLYNRQRAAEPVTLGKNEYFVMGDNRNHSSDSRFVSVGNIERSRILGRVEVCVWPFSKIGKIE